MSDYRKSAEFRLMWAAGPRKKPLVMSETRIGDQGPQAHFGTKPRLRLVRIQLLGGGAGKLTQNEAHARSKFRQYTRNTKQEYEQAATVKKPSSQISGGQQLKNKEIEADDR